MAVASIAVPDLSPIRNRSKSSEVFEKLRAAIWTGDFPPGTPLKEAHLARQFQVSQVPIREALFRLEHLGLVVRVPDRGTHVTDLSREEILQLIEVRSHLEELAFRLASTRLTPAIILNLEHGLKALERAVKAKDHFAAGEADLSFHEIVWKASGNPILAKTLHTLSVPLYAFVSLKRHEAREALATVSHRDLFNALVGGDSHLISTQIREHLQPSSVIPTMVEHQGKKR